MNVQDLGKTCIELVQDAGNLQANPSDHYSRQDLTLHARNVTEKVRHIVDPSVILYIFIEPYNALPFKFKMYKTELKKCHITSRWQDLYHF